MKSIMLICLLVILVCNLLTHRYLNQRLDMLEEEITFLDNLKVCIEEHPIMADWLVEIADRKTEPQTDYKKWDAPPKVDLPTEITTCVSVLASALEYEPTDGEREGE